MNQGNRWRLQGGGSILLRRPLLATFLLFLLSFPVLHGQEDSTRADTSKARPWYDTLTVTKPRYAAQNTFEQIALSAFGALAIPVTAVTGGLTLFPPSLNLLIEDGLVRPGVALSTGIGFGGDTTHLIWFPTVRLQAEFGAYARREEALIVRLGLLRDFPITSIHNRDFFFLAAAAGAGVGYDGAAISPYVEGWFGIANPNGIRFITLYPMHNYGIRLRGGYDLRASQPWLEIGLAATSTFWW